MKWHFKKNGTFLSDVEIEKFYVLTGFIILFNDCCFVLWDAIMISIPSTARSSSIKNWFRTYISDSVRLSWVEFKVENISAWVGTRKSYLRGNNSGYRGFQSRFGVQRLLYEHWQDCSLSILLDISASQWYLTSVTSCQRTRLLHGIIINHLC